ncbi:MAG: hypothetical protein N2B06_01785 [Clostridium sp.]
MFRYRKILILDSFNGKYLIEEAEWREFVYINNGNDHPDPFPTYKQLRKNLGFFQQLKFKKRYNRNTDHYIRVSVIKSYGV